MEFHPAANIFPMMSTDEFNALVQDISENGQREPIYTWQGQIIDGRNRYKACEQLGVSPRTREWDGKGSLTSFVVSLNLHRRHLSPSQHAMVGARIKPMFDEEARQNMSLGGQGLANLPTVHARDKAAEAVGVSSRSVESGSTVLEKGIESLAALVDSDEVAVSLAAEVAAQPAELQEEFVEQVKKGAKPRGAYHNVFHTSDSNEWYTPAPYVCAARKLMGGITLDPASSEKANETVKADFIYTKEDDGFAQDWTGRVWLNPPYGREENEGSNQARWSAKLIAEFDKGNITEAILLVNATPGNKWFAPLWRFPICFPDHRIRFISPDGEMNQPTHSNALVYLGSNEAAFINIFAEFGVVAKRVS
jgi:hypothetical protein